MTTTGAPKSAPEDPLQLLTDFSHYGSLGGTPVRLLGVETPRLAIVPQRLRQQNPWDARLKAELEWLASPESAPAAFLTAFTHGVMPFGEAELAYEALDALDRIAPDRAASNTILAMFVALGQLDHDRAHAALDRARALSLPAITTDTLEALSLAVLEAEVVRASRIIEPHRAALGLRFERLATAFDELLVRYYRLAHNNASCTEMLRTMCSAEPKDERLLVEQMRFHLWIEDGYNAANAATEREAAGATLSPRVRGWLGRARLINNEFAPALTDFDVAIAAATSDTDPAELAEWHDGRAWARANTQRAVSAIDDANAAIALQPRRAAYWIRRGRIHGTLARYRAAADDFQQALAIAPLDCHDSILADIASHRFNSREYALAERAYERAAQDGIERATERARIAQWLELRGASLHFLRRFDEAIDAYTRAIQLAPDMGKAFSDRGEALLELGRNEAAFADLERAVALGYKIGCTYVARAQYFQRKSQHADALRELDEAARLWPTSAQPLELRAQTYDALGEPAKANDDRERAAVLRAARR